MEVVGERLHVSKRENNQTELHFRLGDWPASRQPHWHPTGVEYLYVYLHTGGRGSSCACVVGVGCVPRCVQPSQHAQGRQGQHGRRRHGDSCAARRSLCDKSRSLRPGKRSENSPVSSEPRCGCLGTAQSWQFDVWLELAIRTAENEQDQPGAPTEKRTAILGKSVLCYGNYQASVVVIARAILV